MEQVNVIIGDEQRLTARLIEYYLKDNPNLNLSGIAFAFDSIWSLAEKSNANVLILNASIIKAAGFQLITEFKEKFKNLNILALSDYVDASFIRKCIQVGIVGFVTLSADLSEIVDGIEKVRHGDTFLDMQSLNVLTKEIAVGIERPIAKRDGGMRDPNRVTKREQQIITLIAQENTTAKIAEILNISQRTVDAHRRNVMLKLGVRNTAGLIKLALERGIVAL